MEDCMHGTALATSTTPSDSMADTDLAARAASGDDAAFERIMRRHNRLLFRTARSILKSDAEAEDALQEAYLRAWLAELKVPGNIRLTIDVDPYSFL